MTATATINLLPICKQGGEAKEYLLSLNNTTPSVPQLSHIEHTYYY